MANPSLNLNLLHTRKETSVKLNFDSIRVLTILILYVKTMKLPLDSMIGNPGEGKAPLKGGSGDMWYFCECLRHKDINQ